MGAERTIERLSRGRRSDKHVKTIRLDERVYNKLIQICDIYKNDRTEDGIESTIESMIDSLFDFESFVKIHTSISIIDLKNTFDNNEFISRLEEEMCRERVVSYPVRILVKDDYGSRTSISTESSDTGKFYKITIDLNTLLSYISNSGDLFHYVSSNVQDIPLFEKKYIGNIIYELSKRYVIACIKEFLERDV